MRDTNETTKHETAKPSSTANVRRKALALDWLQKHIEYTLSQPTENNGSWHLFHNDDEKDREGKSLLEVIEKAMNA